MDFQYNLPVNLIFGCGKAALIGEQAYRYGTKTLVVTGKSSSKKTGILDKILKYLTDAGVETVLFDQVESNPLTTTVEKGAELANMTGCQSVIGLGGGSIMDAAKGIAFQSKNDGDISDYIFGIKNSQNALPILLIPTTCGTGSEGNGYAVLTNPITNDKKSLRTNAVIAKVSIIDPELMVTMPRSVLAAVGFDALCHSIEAYIARAGQPLSSLQALESIRLISEALPKVWRYPKDMDSWEKLSLGSTLGGMMIGIAGVTAPHGMEHPASGLRNIVHGHGLSALCPAIYKRTVAKNDEKFAVIATLFGKKTGYDFIDAICNLIEILELPTTLSEQGILPENIPWMAENCMKVSVASMANHPVVFTQTQINEIYEEAL